MHLVQTWNKHQAIGNKRGGHIIGKASNILPKHFPPLEVLYDSLCGVWFLQRKLIGVKLLRWIVATHVERVKGFEESSERGQKFCNFNVVSFLLWPLKIFVHCRHCRCPMLLPLLLLHAIFQLHSDFGRPNLVAAWYIVFKIFIFLMNFL
jgi:hypothetical protein